MKPDIRVVEVRSIDAIENWAETESVDAGPRILPIYSLTPGCLLPSRVTETPRVGLRFAIRRGRYDIWIPIGTTNED